MKRHLALLAACAGAAAFGAIAEPARERGEAILQAKCSRCHAIGREGPSPHNEAPPFRDVVTRYPPEALAEALAEGIVSGHPDMPEFVFEPGEVAAIVTYLDSLKVQQAPESR